MNNLTKENRVRFLEDLFGWKRSKVYINSKNGIRVVIFSDGTLREIHGNSNATYSQTGFVDVLASRDEFEWEPSYPSKTVEIAKAAKLLGFSRVCRAERHSGLRFSTATGLQVPCPDLDLPGFFNARGEWIDLDDIISGGHDE